LKFEFFTDRDLGKRFPEILASAGLSVRRHDDLFPPDCPDEQWLARVGKSGWVAITHNARIRYMPNERDAVVRHSVALLVVVGKAPFKELAQNFVATMPRISEFLERHRAPFIAKIYRPTPAELAKHANAAGSVSLWYPK
jgi:hypothetical protein